MFKVGVSVHKYKLFESKRFKVTCLARSVAFVFVSVSTESY